MMLSRCHLLMWVLLPLGVVSYSMAGTIASDSFDYPPGPLNQQAGGIGWAVPWQAGNNRVSDPGLGYGDGIYSYDAAGQAVTLDGFDSGTFRTFSAAQGTAGTTVYVSLMARVEAAAYGGLSLFDGESEVLFIGKPSNVQSWGLFKFGTGNILAPQGDVGQVTLLVVRLDFLASKANARLYVNPPLAAEPAESAIGDVPLPSLRFDTVRLQAGTGPAEAWVDELRIASTYDEVTPDDAPLVPFLQVHRREAREGGSGETRTMTFTAMLSRPAEEPVSADYSVQEAGSFPPELRASAGEDFVATSGQLTFNAGETQKTFTVIVQGDDEVEADEFFEVRLDKPANALRLATNALGVIENDDFSGPELIAYDGIDYPPGSLAGNEGGLGFSGPWSEVKGGNSVAELGLGFGDGLRQLKTEGGRIEMEGEDRGNFRGLTQALGQEGDQIYISFLADFLSGSYFGLSLFGNGQERLFLGKPFARGFWGIASADGNRMGAVDASGQALLVYSLKRRGSHVRVRMYANPTLGQAEPVESLLGDALVPGFVFDTLRVQMGGSLLDTAHADEIRIGRTYASVLPFTVELPQLTMESLGVMEGDGETVQHLFFELRLSHPIPQEASAVYSTLEATATAGEDYQSVNGQVTFAPFQTTQAIGVPVFGDDLPEENETVILHLSQVVNAELVQDDSLGVIGDDDRPPGWVVTSYGAGEDASLFPFYVELEEPQQEAVSISYAVTDGTATAGEDFVALSGNLTLQPGELRRLVEVTILPDQVPEPHEYFNFELSNSSGPPIVTPTAKGHISDNDSARSSGVWTFLAENFAQVPGDPSRRFVSFDPTSASLNAFGDVVFRATTQSQVDQSLARGIYLFRRGQLQEVAAERDGLPPPALGRRLTGDFSELRLTDSRNIYFVAQTTRPDYSGFDALSATVGSGDDSFEQMRAAPVVVCVALDPNSPTGLRHEVIYESVDEYSMIGRLKAGRHQVGIESIEGLNAKEQLTMAGATPTGKPLRRFRRDSGLPDGRSGRGWSLIGVGDHFVYGLSALVRSLETVERQEVLYSSGPDRFLQTLVHAGQEVGGKNIALLEEAGQSFRSNGRGFAYGGFFLESVGEGRCALLVRRNEAGVLNYDVLAREGQVFQVRGGRDTIVDLNQLQLNDHGVARWTGAGAVNGRLLAHDRSSPLLGTEFPGVEGDRFGGIMAATYDVRETVRNLSLMVIPDVLSNGRALALHDDRSLPSQIKAAASTGDPIRVQNETFLLDSFRVGVSGGSSGDPNYLDGSGAVPVFARVIDSMAIPREGIFLAQLDAFVPEGQGPLIVGQPQSLSLDAGSDAILAVAVDGVGPFRYQWRLNGRNLAGATEPELSLVDLTKTDAGVYTVVVSDLGSGRIETSEPANVTINLPFLELSDTFGQGGVNTESSGQRNSSNRNATREPGEPDHGGKPGAASVWFAWRPQQDGIAHFSTQGSGFDTLMSAYTGGSLADLTKVAGNDDVGRLVTSEIVFTVDAGTLYHVAVDTATEARGPITFCWDLEPTTDIVPTFTLQPLSQSVPEGSVVTLHVDAIGADRYQWFFNEEPVEGVSGPALTLPQVGSTDVGRYRVDAISASARLVSSLRANLEIGPVPEVFSRDRREEWERLPQPAPLTRGVGGSGSSGAITVGAGSVGTQILNNSGDGTSLFEENHCEALASATRWLLLTADADNLTMQVDTSGSEIGTVLACYRSDTVVSTRELLQCDVGELPTNSLISFLTQAGSFYWIVVDGTESAEGVIQLNWILEGPPSITTQPEDQVTRPGGSVAFSVEAAGLPAPTYQWLENDLPLAGAVDPVLTLTNVTSPAAYTVQVDNALGSVLSDPAQLFLAQEVTLEFRREPNGDLVLLPPDVAPGAAVYVIEASTNLIDWESIWTSPADGSATEFTDPDQGLYPARFYRLDESLPASGGP